MNNITRRRQHNQTDEKLDRDDEYVELMMYPVSVEKGIRKLVNYDELCQAVASNWARFSWHARDGMATTDHNVSGIRFRVATWHCRGETLVYEISD